MTRYFAQVPTSVRNAGLTASALRLYLYLDERAGKRGAWYDTHRALAEALHCSRRTIVRAVDELRDAHLLTTESRPDQVLAYFVTHRQERLTPTTEMSQGGDTNVTGEAICPITDHREQPQRTTLRSGHGVYDQFIRRS